MSKISVPANNDFCPQTLYVYGTTNEDGRPDFGLFCWFSFCWFDQLGVICAIGGSKRTLSNIRRQSGGGKEPGPCRLFRHRRRP